MIINLTNNRYLQKNYQITLIELVTTNISKQFEMLIFILKIIEI